MDQHAILARASRDFFIAASHLLNRKLDTPLPCLFLLARSIELALKSLLTSAGMSTANLAKRTYGHNLVKLLDEADRRGLLDRAMLDSHEVSAIELLNRDYSSAQMGYPESGRSYLLPRLDLVDEATKKLIQLASAASSPQLESRPECAQ